LGKAFFAMMPGKTQENITLQQLKSTFWDGLLLFYEEGEDTFSFIS